MTVPKQHAAALAVSLALMTTGEHAVAQTAPEMEFRLQAGSLVSERPGRTPLDAMAITPALRYADSRLMVKTRASAWLNGQTWLLGSSEAEVELYQPLMYGIRAELLANASRVFHDPAHQNDQVDAGGRLHYMRQRGGIWLGSGVARPLRASAVSNVNVSSGGIWTTLGPTTLRGSVTSFFFTKVSADSVAGDAVSCSSTLNSSTNTGTPIPSGSVASLRALPATGCRIESRLTDLEASVRWEHRLLELTMRGGRRFGDSFDATPESREWASGQVAFWISSQVAAVAGGGREPAQPTRGLPARSFGSLGIMLAYWPIPRGVVPVETPASMVQAFELRPAGSVQRISARIGGVETVEIMGDFSDWEALPLIRRGRDQWELLVPMAPGVHRINLRIDGGIWIAPPGMPSVKDGFNGDVGVVVVK